VICYVYTYFLYIKFVKSCIPSIFIFFLWDDYHAKNVVALGVAITKFVLMQPQMEANYEVKIL
jgi:hypothetical protein